MTRVLDCFESNFVDLFFTRVLREWTIQLRAALLIGRHVVNFMNRIIMGAV